MSHLCRTLGAASLLVFFVSCTDQPTAPEDARASLAAAAAAPLVTAIDLGTLGGDLSFAYGVNDSGEVVGRSQNANGVWHAFVWRPGEGMTDLGTLRSYAYGINEAGVMAGWSELPNGRRHTIRWSPNGTPTDLGTLGGPHSGATDINEVGAVSGHAHTPSGALHAVVWDAAGVATDLGTLPGARSVAKDVNDLGHAVGWSDAGPGWQNYHGFLWTPAGGMVDVGTLGGATSSAEEVNNLGLVVGISQTAGGVWHAFSWTNSEGMDDLGVSAPGLDSRAYGVNDFGQIVGSAAQAAGGSLGFVMDRTRPVVLLGTLGGGNSAGSDISAFGKVAGYAQNPQGYWHAALWTVPPAPAAQIDRLQGLVGELLDAGTLRGGEANALLSKLGSADRQAAKGNTTAAANQLGAFINGVEALARSGRMSVEEAEALISGAARIVDQLGG